MSLFGIVAAMALQTSNASMPALYPSETTLSAKAIIEESYVRAGGEYWRRPETLAMSGYGVFYRDGKAVVYDDYRMWRVYYSEKKDAHRADGKVRIEASKDGERVFLIAFDGEKTHDANGPIADQTANVQWASNFGFGAIRHALDDGWMQKRLPDDLIDGTPAFFIELQDPSGGVTRFAIDQTTFQVLYVGFDTERGWHERRYSDFFTKPGVDWVQPGRVRLFYNGVKQNEVIWTDFEVNAPLDDALFEVQAP